MLRCSCGVFQLSKVTVFASCPTPRRLVVGCTVEVRLLALLEVVGEGGRSIWTCVVVLLLLPARQPAIVSLLRILLILLLSGLRTKVTSLLKLMLIEWHLIILLLLLFLLINSVIEADIALAYHLFKGLLR